MVQASPTCETGPHAVSGPLTVDPAATVVRVAKTERPGRHRARHNDGGDGPLAITGDMVTGMVEKRVETPGARRTVGRYTITSLFDSGQHLRAVIAVAEFGSISHAAKALGTTQPAISRRLAALEQASGIRLFDRSRRHGTRPTVIGMYVIELAQRVLAEMDMADRVLREVREATEPEQD